MNTLIGFCLVLCSGADDIQARIDQARKDYDLGAAQALVAELSKAGPQAAADQKLALARSLLLLGELYRVEFEGMEENGADHAERRALGDKIDETAKVGFQAADALGEISEAYRVRSDLYGIMIRTKFQGKKYRSKLEGNSAKALQLDPKNADAYVSVARPYLFAGPLQGGNLKKAMELLNKALELNPNLVSAQMLHAVGLEKQGDKAQSDAEWKKILEENPKTARSKKTLEIAGKVWKDDDDK